MLQLLCCACRNVSRARAHTDASRLFRKLQRMVPAERFPRPARANSCHALSLLLRRVRAVSPIVGVFLTSADVDSVTGLLHLRESTPLAFSARRRCNEYFERKTVCFAFWSGPRPRHSGAVSRRNRNWFPLPTGDPSGEIRLSVTRAVPLGGYYPDYVSCTIYAANLRRRKPRRAAVLSAGKSSIFCAFCLRAISDEWKKLAESSDLCFFGWHILERRRTDPGNRFWQDGARNWSRAAFRRRRTAAAVFEKRSAAAAS